MIWERKNRNSERQFWKSRTRMFFLSKPFDWRPHPNTGKLILWWGPAKTFVRKKKA
jgi:hypothetical protein